MIRSLVEVFLILSGQRPYSDIAQDFYGFRALCLRADAYAPINEAVKTLGLDWRVFHSSTHPPTAFLLTAPVAFLPWPVASAIWGWLMLVAIVASLRLYGLGWRWIALLLPVLCVWPPFVYSLEQLVPIWLLGIALAYRKQETPFWAGVWIGFASLTKFLPGILLIPFLLRRKWSTVSGFTAVWIIALVLVIALHPGAIPSYLTINGSTTPETINRLDNGAFLPSLLRFFGLPGMAAGLLFLLLIAWVGRKNWYTWEFLAVALLPIAWIYSLFPLLPGMIAKQKTPFTVAAFVLIIFMPPMGFVTPYYMSIFFVLYGIVFFLPPQHQRKTDQVIIQ
jgi:hypothetical protein